MRRMVLILGLAAIPIACPAQSAPLPEILVLGTYHMANPGRDIHNMQSDDVLSPRRQQEMGQLIEVLRKFHPTKIAIEVEVGSQRVAREYADYLAGTYTLSRNEDDQIGYRLARELGHHSIYPVDEGSDFPYERVLNYAKANSRLQKFEALSAAVDARVKAEGEFLRSHTVLEMLEHINSDSMVAEDVAGYYAYIPFADPGDYAGPDLVAVWFQRNIRIYHNIVALIDSPNERILVIYGAGHLGWLRQDVANDATVRLRKLADLTAHH